MLNLMRVLIVLSLPLLLMSCSSSQIKCTPAQKIPPVLTLQTPVPTLSTDAPTCREVTGLVLEYHSALQKCNQDKTNIKTLAQ